MRSFMQELRVSTALLVPIFIYAIFAWILLEPLGRSSDIFQTAYGSLTLRTWGVAFALIFVAYSLHLVLVRRPKRPVMVMISELRVNVLAPSQLLMRLTPLVMLTPLLNCLTAIKTAIPLIKPFSYDALFAEIDRAIFGTDPWVITHALFGNPYATWSLQFAYTYWFFLMWISVIYAAVKTDLRVFRVQYLLSFALTWIVLGSIAALLLSSAGPCFYGSIVPGPDPFAPLMERLRVLDTTLRELKIGTGGVDALELQAMLWKSYLSSNTSVGSGISAMPSLHVGIAVLMARAAFDLNRKLGIGMTMFALMIWVGSVHFGWHYAIDGMVSAPLVLIIWGFAGRVANWLEVTNPDQRRVRALGGPATVARTA